MLRGNILAERGDTVAGLAEAAAALEFARSVQDQLIFAALTGNALLLIRAGREREAARFIDEALTVPSYPVALVELAFALVLLGRAHQFERLDDAIRATPWGTIAEAICRGDNATAVDMLATTGARSYEAEARLLLARQLSEAGRHADAAREAAVAAGFFRSVGALPRAREADAAGTAPA